MKAENKKHENAIKQAFADLPYCVKYYTKLLIDLIEGKSTSPDTWSCASVLRQRIGGDNDAVKAVEAALKRLDKNVVWSDRIIEYGKFGITEYPGCYWIKAGPSACRPFGMDQVYQEI